MKKIYEWGNKISEKSGYWDAQNAVKLLYAIYNAPSRIISLEDLRLEANFCERWEKQTEIALEILRSEDLVACSGNLWYTTTRGSLLVRMYG